MSLDQIKQRVDALTKRHAAASKKKSELKGQLAAKKQELVELKKEIEAAGFDPKNLKEEKTRLEGELEEMIQTFEKELAEVEAVLDAYDKK